MDKKPTLKKIAFVLGFIGLVVLNMVVFRSAFPMLWFVTLIGSVVILIIFPYNKLN